MNYKTKQNTNKSQDLPFPTVSNVETLYWYQKKKSNLEPEIL